MSAQGRYVTIGVSVIAWSGVLLTATYRSHTPVVLGQYSWGHVTLLGLLVCIAVMAEPLANHMVSFWSKKASPTMVAAQRERAVGRAIAEINAFAMGLAQTLAEARSYFVSLFMSCKRVTRSLMSGESHP